MLGLPSFSTPATDALCKEIARKSKGICFLGMSGGKDSVCAWLQLRKFFDTIIPFHCATIPGMVFREKALRHYEEEFDQHILRMMDASLTSDLIQGIYQLREDGPFISEQGWHRYDKLELVEFLRTKYNLPRAWCAFGIQASDSQDRRIQCVQYQGRHDSNKTFYPCWDWPHGKIIETVRESGIRLGPEYLYSSRTIEGTPSATYTTILRKHFPRDYKELVDWYPLVEAKVFREKINERVSREMMLRRVEAEKAQQEETIRECEAEAEEGERILEEADRTNGGTVVGEENVHKALSALTIRELKNQDRLKRRRALKRLCWEEAKALGMKLKDLEAMKGTPEEVAEAIHDMKVALDRAAAERAPFAGRMKSRAEMEEPDEGEPTLGGGDGEDEFHFEFGGDGLADGIGQ